MPRPFSRRAALVAGAAGIAVAVVAACGSAESRASTGVGPVGPPSAAEVERARRQLDERAASAPSSVVSWGVDPALGLVVVRVTGGRTAEVDRFLSGVDPRTLRVVTDAEPVRPLPGPS